MIDRRGAGCTESGFAPTLVLAHTASQDENRVVVHVVACGPGNAGDHVGTTALGGASRFSTGALAIISGDAFDGNADGNAFVDVRGSADGVPADTAAGSAVSQRVKIFFYRMRAVYRAGIGFVSRGSLNPVGKGRA